jgi:excisionase family DNA binding protein
MMRLYSASEVARLVGVSPKTVRSWCQMKKIKAFRLLNGRWRIPESEVMRLLGDNKKPDKLEELIDLLKKQGLVFVSGNRISMDLSAIDAIEEFNRENGTEFDINDVRRALLDRFGRGYDGRNI